MSDVRTCVLGCSTPDGIPFRAAPGRRACNRCAEKLAGVLSDIAHTYATLTEIDELTPGGNADSSGVRTIPGPRSPAVDALLVLADPRSTGDEGVPALSAVASWARLIREERSLDTPPDRMLSTVPAGRITMTRELGTIRFNWDWVLGQDWLPDFAERMRALLAALRTIGGMTPRVLQIGTCPKPVMAIMIGTNDTVPLLCGARLRVRVGDTEIRCRNCGTTWLRDRWYQLGDPWTDYARLSEELTVPVATLRWWCHEDGWRTQPSPTSKKRVLVCRTDAVISYARRKQGKVA